MIFICTKPFAASGFEMPKHHSLDPTMSKAVPVILSLIPLAAVIGACVACP